MNPILSAKDVVKFLDFEKDTSKQYNQHGKLYYLFHHRRITKDLMAKLHAISSPILGGPGPEAKAVLDESKWFLENVLEKQIFVLGNQREKFSEALFAARLNIPIDVVQNETNKGVLAFFQDNGLIRPISNFFNHPVKYNPDTKEIQVLVAGEYKEWRDVQKTPELVRLDYNYQGIVVRTKDNQYKPVPLGILPEGARPKKPQVEIVSIDTNYKGHAWMRLKHPNGEVYSFGLYRGLNAPKMKYTTSFATSSGSIKSPDPSEFQSNMKMVGKSEDITEEQFQSMIEKLGKQEYREKQSYNALDRNCANWAIKSFNSVVKKSRIIELKDSQLSEPRRIPLSKIQHPLFKKGGFIVSILKRFLGWGKNLFVRPDGKVKDRKVIDPKTKQVMVHYPPRVYKWIASESDNPVFLGNQLGPGKN